MTNLGENLGEHANQWRDVCGPTSVISANQLEEFNRDGFVVIEDAFHHDTVDSIAEAIISVRDENSWLQQFAAHPLLAGIARDLIGPDANLLGQHPSVRPPQSPQSTEFVQDSHSPDGTNTVFVTCWIALTNSTVENGCLRVVPGLHRFGPLKLSAETDIGDSNDSATTIDGPPQRHIVDGAQGKNVPMSAGSVAVMSSLLPHRFLANTTKMASMAYVTQYVAVDNLIVDVSSQSRNSDGSAMPSLDLTRVVEAGQLVRPY